MTKPKIGKEVKRHDYTKLHRGARYWHNGQVLEYSKMIKGSFRFKDALGNPVTIEQSEYNNIRLLTGKE